MPMLNLPLQTRAASITPTSGGNHIIVWSTGSKVRRYDWFEDQEILEELVLSGADLTRLNRGAPVLDSHQTDDVSSVIGVVERAWLEGNEGRAEIRLSERPELEGIRRDVASGILRHVSIGYAINEVVRIPAAKRGQPDTLRQRCPVNVIGKPSTLALARVRRALARQV